MKNILLLCTVLLLVVAAFQQAAAQEKDYQFKLQVTGSDLVVTPVIPAAHKSGEWYNYLNETNDSVTIKITNDHGLPLTTLRFGNAETRAYCMPGENVEMCFIYTVAGKGTTDTTCSTSTSGVPTPTLSQWGLISLLVLILASGVIVAMRKRTAVV